MTEPLIEILTVSELTDRIKFELEEKFPGVWVTGEISNYIHHSSGHRYFTLKDANAQIKCVLWKFVGQYLTFTPVDGIKVKLFGDLTVFPKNGVYQIRVAKLMPMGIGDLEARFQILKEKLFKEGLFADEHKRPLPPLPETIGLITSPTGAAIRDLISIISRRAPWVKIIVAPVHVQGEGAAEEIAAAIERFNRFGMADLLIAGRGGGSLEDLWAFNEEIVARAIYNSQIPIISAVGHEIDFTIADLVADLRAPTPSAAAELAVPDSLDLQAGLGKFKARLARAALTYIHLSRERLRGLTRSPIFKRPLEFIYQRQQTLDGLTSELVRQIGSHIAIQKSGLLSLGEKLTALSPEAILRRGFAVVRGFPDSRILKDSRGLSSGDRVRVKLYEGGFSAVIDQTDSEIN